MGTRTITKSDNATPDRIEAEADWADDGTEGIVIEVWHEGTTVPATSEIPIGGVRAPNHVESWQDAPVGVR